MKKMSNKEAKYWNDMIDKIARDLGIDKIKKCQVMATTCGRKKNRNIKVVQTPT